MVMKIVDYRERIAEGTWRPFEKDGLLKEYEYDVWEYEGEWMAAVRRVGDGGFGFAGAHETFEQAVEAAGAHIESYEDWERFLVRNPEVVTALNAVSEGVYDEPVDADDLAAFKNFADVVQSAMAREWEGLVVRNPELRAISYDPEARTAEDNAAVRAAFEKDRAQQ